MPGTSSSDAPSPTPDPAPTATNPLMESLFRRPASPKEEDDLGLDEYLKTDEEARRVLEGYCSSSSGSLHLSDLIELEQVALRVRSYASDEREPWHVRRACLEFGHGIGFAVDHLIAAVDKFRFALVTARKGELSYLDPVDLDGFSRDVSELGFGRQIAGVLPPSQYTNELLDDIVNPFKKPAERP